VVSEAAALGTPTIAYDVPGLRDSTRAAGGVVVPPTPEAMARWLVELLPALCERPVAPVPYGGARCWDDVAAAVLSAVRERARVPAAATATPARPGWLPRPALQEAS
jgi:hypothetical protein